MEPSGAPALYWYASNLGRWARAKEFSSTLGNGDRIRAALERCLALDATCSYGGPDRSLGALFAVAPGVAGGDGGERGPFRKSLATSPEDLATRGLMAETLAVEKPDRARSRQLLEDLLAALDDAIADLVPGARVEKQKATELLKEIDDGFWPSGAAATAFAAASPGPRLQTRPGCAFSLRAFSPPVSRGFPAAAPGRVGRMAGSAGDAKVASPLMVARSAATPPCDRQRRLSRRAGARHDRRPT